MMANFISVFLLVVLSTTTSSLAQQTCPPQGASFVPHSDCTKFIFCNEGQASMMDCPPNLYFNAEISVCDFPGNVPECVGGTRPPSGSTPPPTTEGTTERDTTPQPTTPSTPPPTTTAEPDPTVLTNCGDTIISNTGRIEYKFEETYEANEICSFVVRAELFSSGIVFRLEGHGFNATADPSAITILTFGSKGHIETSHLGPPNPLTETYVSGNVAVVVFKTTGNRGTGFKLSFSAVIENPNYGFTGVNLVYSNLTGGELTIPFWENPAYMTSVIVLSANHKKITSFFDYLRLTFINENLEKNLENTDSCGYDAIHVYSFLSDDARHEGTFCNILTQKSVFQTTGILIMVFRDFDASYWQNANANFKWEIITK